MIKNKIFLTILFTLTGLTMANDTENKKAVFAAGCFWGVESTFQQMEGVKTTTVGYIARDIRTGKDAEEIATNPLNYLGAAFMNPGEKALGRAGASRGLLGIASHDLAGTAAAPLLAPLSIGAGLAALGTLGYPGYKAVTGKNRSDEEFFR